MQPCYGDCMQSPLLIIQLPFRSPVLWSSVCVAQYQAFRPSSLTDLNTGQPLRKFAFCLGLLLLIKPCEAVLAPTLEMSMKVFTVKPDTGAWI
jgi:hypothetical protein